MRSRKNILLVVVVLTLSLAAQSALAGGITISASFGRPSISHHSQHRSVIVPRYHRYSYRSPFYRRVIVRPRIHSRFVKICPPPIVITTPPVVVSRPVQVVEPTTITVWFTNTNGSQSSVELTHSGPGYIGPRGEYYPSMPTGEQLRMVYGF